MAPRLSAVVPFYNVQDYIGECLESLRRQTMADFEVILVDDGSQDGSLDVAQQHVDLDHRFRIVRQENRGLGPARNTGTGHATGEYLAFVDSDDLLAWHAFDVMVRTLDETGSSFAASNARRFSRSGGVRPSWAHRHEFARWHLATHILERPGLVMDRMVWNKVYRREFFTSHGLSFPPIRYEDYPVTLRAHLEALTVDVIASPLYYWRERETGDSITQQVFHLGNLTDRVASAELVIGVAERATWAVVSRLQAHLAEVDLVALLQAFASVPDHDTDDLLMLGNRLLDRMDARVLADRPAFDRLQMAALRRDDVDYLRKLARFRGSGSVPSARFVRRRGRPWILEASYPGRGRPGYDRELFRMGREALQLETQVSSVAWVGSRLLVSGSACLSKLDAVPSDEVTVTLVGGATTIPVPVLHRSVEEGSRGRREVRFTCEMDLAHLAALPAVAWPLSFRVGYRHRRWSREAPWRNLREGSPLWSSGTWMSHDTWVHPSRGRDGGLQLTRTPQPLVVHDVIAQGAGFRIVGEAPYSVSEARLVIPRRKPSAPSLLQVSVPEGSNSRFEVHVPLSELLHSESPEDPYTRRMSWQLSLDAGDGPRPLLWASDYDSATLAHGSQTLSLTTTPDHRLIAVQQPAQTEVREARLDHCLVSAEGVWWPRQRPVHIVWRRFLPDSDAFVDAECDLKLSGGTWRASAAVSALHPDGPAINAPGSTWEWTLMALTDQGPESVLCTGRAAMALPQVEVGSEWTMKLTTVRGTLHLGVR